MKLFKILLPVALLTSMAHATYTNCTFKDKNYEDICKAAVHKGVSIEYANRFLLCYFKTQKFDEKSWKYLQPSKIKYHKQREKQANNALLSSVGDMVKNLQEYQEVYTYTEKKYGVNKEIIAAILLKETRLGKIKPRHDAFIVFNTIVKRTQPDSARNKWLLKMGKTNMTAIIAHCYKGGIEPKECNLPSSYAGAIGIPQFMPNSFQYTQSYKGKVADLNTMEDAILSVGKFLHKKAHFDTPIKWDKIHNMAEVEQAWYHYEFTHENASFVYEKSRTGKRYNCFTRNKPQLQYMKSYVKKIMRYNNSSNYAIGVLRLAYEAHKQYTTLEHNVSPTQQTH